MSEFNLTEWLKTLGPYPTTAVLLAVLAPTVLGGWGGPASSVHEYWSSALISGALAIAGVFASQHNLSGPLRFGLSKYTPSLKTLSQSFPDGTVWALVLARFIVPWGHAWVAGLLSVWWHFTLQHFREAVRDASDQARDLCARATIAAEQGAEAAAAAARLETDALTRGMQAAQDARLKRGTSASDFFGAAASAWSAIDNAARAIGSASSYSSNAIEAADSATRSYSTSSSASNYAQYTRNAASHVNEANAQAQAALKVMTDFQAAKDHDYQARERALAEQERVRRIVSDLADKAQSLAGSAKGLADRAQAARHQATRALALAEQGKSAEAAKAAVEATKAVGALETEAKRTVQLKAEIHTLFVKLALED